jgi:hypothetical protein
MEYRSSASFLGLPLGHIATGALIDGRYRRGVAIAWFAVGDITVGVFFACGGAALGGISLGGAALGLLPIGGLALGLLAVGGLGLGLVAVGGAAFAWYAAIGGLAVAHDYAIGGVALARNVITSPSSGLCHSRRFPMRHFTGRCDRRDTPIRCARTPSATQGMTVEVDSSWCAMPANPSIERTATTGMPVAAAHIER